MWREGNPFPPVKMCIRDRHRGIQVNHANAFSGYIVQHHIVQLEGDLVVSGAVEHAADVNAVSYTHLDVYKRQDSLPATYVANRLNQYTDITEGTEPPFVPTYDADGKQTKIQTTMIIKCLFPVF